MKKNHYHKTFFFIAINLILLTFTGCHSTIKNFWEKEQLKTEETQKTAEVQLTWKLSEYKLAEYPKGIITIDDFRATGKLLTREEAQSLIKQKKLGVSTNTALVALYFYEDGHLETPYEFNYYNDFPEEEPKKLVSPETIQRATDLKTFHELTGLEEASEEYVELLLGSWFFDTRVSEFQTREEKKEAIRNILEEANQKKKV